MTERAKLRIGVLASGSGTNLQRIIDAAESGEIDVDVRVVVSDNRKAYALDRARMHKIHAVWADRTAHRDVSAFNGFIRDTMIEHQVEYVVMAGYMRLLGTPVLNAFPDKVLNIHPALLPSFPGAHGISDAFEYGVKVAGVTVHFANEVFDDGPIIAQEAVPVLEDDTLESLEERIHEAEYRIYPIVLQQIAEGRLSLDGRHVRITPRQAT